MPGSVPTRQKACWGLFTRKERWGISLRGLGVAVLVFAVAGCAFILGVYPFLAVSNRVESDTLVVEGWVHDYAITAAANEFKRGHYRRLLTTGGPEEGSGGYTNDYNTSASVAASRLRNLGLSKNLVLMVPAKATERDRTFQSALALREWLRHNEPLVHAIDIVTADVHARRTRLLYQVALGPGIDVGMIPVASPDFDPAHWWKYSEGVRETLSEFIAYLYARLIFVPIRAGSERAGDLGDK